MYDSLTLGIVAGALVVSFFADPESTTVYSIIKTVTWGLIAATVAIFTFVYIRIISKNDKSVIAISHSDLSTIYDSILPPPEVRDDITTVAYDKFQLSITMLGAVIGFVIANLFSFRSGTITPIIIFAALTFGRFIVSPLFSIHVLGQSVQANRDLRRPWKQADLNPITAAKELIKEVKREMKGGSDKPTYRNKRVENRIKVARSG